MKRFTIISRIEKIKYKLLAYYDKIDNQEINNLQLYVVHNFPKTFNLKFDKRSNL